MEERTIRNITLSPDYPFHRSLITQHVTNQSAHTNTEIYTYLHSSMWEKKGGCAGSQ